MPDTGLWFERKFEFAFSADLFPNLCVRLRGTPVRLEEMLRGWTRDLLIARNGEKWTIQEQAGHLLDLEELWSSRVDDFAEGKHHLSAADLQNRKTHEANHNTRQIEDILAEFRTARSQLVAKLESLDHSVIVHTLLHPRLQQPMRLVDHLFFVAEHDDHHLAKIWSALRT
ncbi:MAG TPA: DinB family protein [Candidatus Acidoferrum sp.]|nr:DinB family protein [Candidatus Acidoferrum sp.]